MLRTKALCRLFCHAERQLSISECRYDKILRFAQNNSRASLAHRQPSNHVWQTACMALKRVFGVGTETSSSFYGLPIMGVNKPPPQPLAYKEREPGFPLPLQGRGSGG